MPTTDISSNKLTIYTTMAFSRVFMYFIGLLSLGFLAVAIAVPEAEPQLEKRQGLSSILGIVSTLESLLTSLLGGEYTISRL